MPDQERFNYLLDLYVSGKLSAQEYDELFDLISSHHYDELLGKHLLHDLKEGEHIHSADLPPHVAQEIIRNIYQAEKDTIRMLPASKTLSIRRRWMAAASVVLLMLSASLYYFH